MRNLAGLEPCGGDRDVHTAPGGDEGCREYSPVCIACTGESSLGNTFLKVFWFRQRRD